MAATRSGSSEGRAWILPESLRSTFRLRYGPVRSGLEAERAILGLQLFATCGDWVTAQAIELGKIPFIGIVDLKTQRNARVDPNAFTPLAQRGVTYARNPAGMITEELREAVKLLFAGGGGLLTVDGEEDLAVMPLIEVLPFGATVIYGVPGEGASFLTVDAEAKARVAKLLAEMEVRRVNLGG